MQLMVIGLFSHYFFGISITLLSVFLVLLVLVQRGRGGGLVGALGGPGGQSALGTKAGDLFTRITVVVATLWIFLCATSVYVLNPSGEKSPTGLADEVTLSPKAPEKDKGVQGLGESSFPLPGSGLPNSDPTLPALATPETKPAETKPNAQPADDKPTEPSPSDAKPSEPTPADAKPPVPNSTEPKPAEPKPTEPTPADAKPTEPKPTEPKPTEPKPTEPAAGDAKPIEPSPGEAKPKETNPQ